MTYCTKCGNDVRDDDAFCNKCGILLSRFCSNCGVKANTGDIFCPKCGKPLAIEGPTPSEISDIPKDLSLNSGEKYLARHNSFIPFAKTTIYATDQRIIFKTVNIFSKRTSNDIPYRHITKIKKSTDRPYLPLTIRLAITGIFLSAILFLIYYTHNKPLSVLVIGLIMLGVCTFSILFGVFKYRENLDLERIDGEKFKIPDVASVNGDNIASIIRKQLVEKNSAKKPQDIEIQIRTKI